MHVHEHATTVTLVLNSKRRKKRMHQLWNSCGEVEIGKHPKRRGKAERRGANKNLAIEQEKQTSTRCSFERYLILRSIIQWVLHFSFSFSLFYLFRRGPRKQGLQGLSENRTTTTPRREKQRRLSIFILRTELCKDLQTRDRRDNRLTRLPTAE